MTASDLRDSQSDPKWPPPTRREVYDQTVGVDGSEKLAAGLAESLAARDVADLAVQRAREALRDAPSNEAALTAVRSAELEAQRARWRWEDWASVAADHQWRAAALAEKVAAREGTTRFASAAPVLRPWVAAHPELNPNLAGVLLRIPNVPGPWRADSGASWDFGHPLPDYPGATFDSRHKVWLIPDGGGASPRGGCTIVFPVGRTVHLSTHWALYGPERLERLTRGLADLWAEGERQPLGSEDRLRAVLRIRERARLARAKGACEALVGMSDRRRSRSVQEVARCWADEYKRAKLGLYVRYNLPRTQRQEVMAHFDAHGRLCEWCGRKVAVG